MSKKKWVEEPIEINEKYPAASNQLIKFVSCWCTSETNGLPYVWKQLKDLSEKFPS